MKKVASSMHCAPTIATRIARSIVPRGQMPISRPSSIKVNASKMWDDVDDPSGGGASSAFGAG